MHALALVVQQACLLGRAFHIAGKFVAGEMTADHADAAIAQREQQAGADHAEHHADQITEIADGEHDGDGEREIGARALAPVSEPAPPSGSSRRDRPACRPGSPSARRCRYRRRRTARWRRRRQRRCLRAASPRRASCSKQAVVQRQIAGHTAKHRSEHVGETIGADIPCRDRRISAAPLRDSTHRAAWRWPSRRTRRRFRRCSSPSRPSRCRYSAIAVSGHHSFNSPTAWQEPGLGAVASSETKPNSATFRMIRKTRKAMGSVRYCGHPSPKQRR